MSRPPAKRRASNRNRSSAAVHVTENSSCRDGVGVSSAAKSNVAKPATLVTVTTVESGFKIRPRISSAAAAMALATTATSRSSFQRADNGIPSVQAKSAAAALTFTSPVKFQVLKNGTSTPSQLANTLSTPQPIVPASLTNPLTATTATTWPPTAPTVASLSSPTQVSPILTGSGRQLHIGLELILSNGVRIPISATCAGLKPENDTQRPVAGATSFALPTLASEKVAVAAKTVTIPVESTVLSAASNQLKSSNSVSPVTSNNQKTLTSATETLSLKSLPNAVKSYYSGEGGGVEDEEDEDDELSDNADVSVSAATKADLEAAAGANRSRICSCLRSNCLKLYCDCFAAGRACEGCHCRHCRNNLSDDITRRARDFAMRMALARNPRAFKPKIGLSANCSGHSAPGEHEKSRHDSRGATNSSTTEADVKTRPVAACSITTSIDTPASTIQTLSFPASSVTERPTSIQSLLLSSPLVSPELLNCLRGQHVVVAATPALKGTSAPASQISLIPGLSTASRVISLATTTVSTTAQSSVASSLSGNQTATPSSGVGNGFATLGRLIINAKSHQQQQPQHQQTVSAYSETATPEIECDEPGTETVTVAAVDAPIDYSEYTEEELELMQSLLEENSGGNRVCPANIDSPLHPPEHATRAGCCGHSSSQAFQNHLDKSSCPEIHRAPTSTSPVEDSTDHISIQLECSRTRPMSLPSMENSPENSPLISPRHHHPESYSLSAPASISSQPEWVTSRKFQSATAAGGEDISVLVQKIRVLERRVAKLMHVVQAQGNALRDISARVRHTKRCGCWSSSSSVSNSGTVN
ncbi:unnamed protein product [Schistocephalus solidus]|uniref:CRC domain-containing protein n=1 Tax=Schistocephalus solidus TaxID=70667 RepID=A0A183SNV4_SCHSO|nr:unnamed protein product [Schistocephalus solidus]